MLRPCRCVLPALAVLGAGATVFAQNPTTVSAAGTPASATAEAAPLPPDLQAELERLLPRAWTFGTMLRGSAGWRDNVLLSPFAPIGRAFARAEVETMLWRPAQESWELLAFLNGDVLRYVSAPAEIGGEQQWSALGEARWWPVAPVRLSLKTTGYLRDTVIDLSETEATRVVIPTRVRGGIAMLGARWALPAGFTLEPTGQAKRTTYRDYPGEYDEARGGVRLEWKRSERFGVAVAWADVRRDYAEREQYSAGGRALAGTRLSFRQRDGELRLQSRWQTRGRWSATAVAGRLENRDEASGYFDYDQQRARLEIDWQPKMWRLTLSGDARRLEYLGQTVGAGTAPPRRISDDYEATFRVERELRPAWSVFAEHRWERSRSNEAGFSYRANTSLAGVQRSF